MKSYYLLLFYLLIANLVSAQHKLSGKVIDAASRQPLPFVNIIFNLDPKMGTTTDIDGHFSYQSNSSLNTLSLSYVGYRSDTITVDKDLASLQIPSRKNKY